MSLPQVLTDTLQGVPVGYGDTRTPFIRSAVLPLFSSEEYEKQTGRPLRVQIEIPSPEGSRLFVPASRVSALDVRDVESCRRKLVQAFPCERHRSRSRKQRKQRAQTFIDCDCRVSAWYLLGYFAALGVEPIVNVFAGSEVMLRVPGRNVNRAYWAFWGILPLPGVPQHEQSLTFLFATRNNADYLRKRGFIFRAHALYGLDEPESR